MECITSPKNETVKLIRSLALKKYRSEAGLFAAEGRGVVERARLHGWAPQTLLLSEDSSADELIAWCTSHGGRCSRASHAVMEAVSTQGNPSDCVGVFAQRWLDGMPEVKPDALWLALENSRDPGNLGTIIRTAEAVSAAGLILIGPSCDPYARDCVRATMGSIFALPLLKLDTAQTTDLLKSWPGETVGTAAGAREDYRRAYRSPTLVVMGSEGDGLSPELSRLCKSLVRIPMSGGTESLNLAVATGLMLYEIRRAFLA
jgi:TrmH family RNA methyltransferase